MGCGGSRVTDQHQETDDDYWYTEFTASNGSKHDLYFSHSD